jgi:hypothetical protein
MIPFNFNDTKNFIRDLLDAYEKKDKTFLEIYSKYGSITEKEFKKGEEVLQPISRRNLL